MAALNSTIGWWGSLEREISSAMMRWSCRASYEIRWKIFHKRRARQNIFTILPSPSRRVCRRKALAHMWDLNFFYFLLSFVDSFSFPTSINSNSSSNMWTDAIVSSLCSAISHLLNTQMSSWRVEDDGWKSLFFFETLRDSNSHQLGRRQWKKWKEKERKLSVY